MKRTILVLVTVLAPLALTATACSSSSASEADAVAKCQQAVEQKYVKKQLPVEFDKVVAKKDGDNWTVTGGSRGSHEAGPAVPGPTFAPGRSSKGMAHMSFSCTLKGQDANVDTFELAR